MKTKAERALWFLESYGVTLDTLSVEDTGGQHIDLHTGNSGHKIYKYEALPENQRTKVKEVLHIMNKFSVGDAAYHALTVLEHDLPRSYILIKQCRTDIKGSSEG